jgi:aspartate aminotransferase-like enzyme
VLACGLEAESYEVEWGEAHDPDEVERRLRRGGFDALTVVHSETSTGVLNPLAAIAAAARAAEGATGAEILVLADGVTSVGGARVEPEAWGVDLLLTGSQKALALPPGLAFATASARLMTRAATLPARGYYTDLLEYDRHWANHQTPTTPAISLLFALDEQLRHIGGEGGIDAREARHTAMARRCEEWAGTVGAEHGLHMLARAGARSPTVATLRVNGREPGAIVTALKERGWVVGSGYGRLKPTTIRIGHMGDHSVEGVNALLHELEDVLAR